MAVIENGLDAFTERVVDKRITGYTFDEIAKEMGVPTVEVVKTWKSYVDNRMEMSSEEQFVLMLLRLENFLTKANERLTNAKGADDYELVLKIYDRIEALLAINKVRKGEAQEALEQLTRQQTQLILSAMLALKDAFRAEIQSVIDGSKTIKAIRGELVDKYETRFMPLAITSLSNVGEFNE